MRDEIISMAKAGMNVEDIAEELGLDETYVNDLLIEEGVL